MWFVVKHAEFLVAFQIHKRFDKGTYGSESRGKLTAFRAALEKIFSTFLLSLLMYSEGDNDVRSTCVCVCVWCIRVVIRGTGNRNYIRAIPNAMPLIRCMLNRRTKTVPRQDGK